MAHESKLMPTDSRRPGRPPRSGNEPTVRAQLIDSAARLFAERGYGEASMRQIAENAGVTPAMVSYYFKDKLGLLEAVLDSVFDRLLSRTVELFEDPQQRGSAIERFIEIYLAALTAEPWIPRLLVREVLSENTPVRQRFVERFASKAAAIVPALLGEQIGGGRLRGDLDPRLAVLSLVGMCVFPLIAQPVIGPLLGYELDADFIHRLSRHTQRLFLHGTAEASP